MSRIWSEIFEIKDNDTVIGLSSVDLNTETGRALQQAFANCFDTNHTREKVRLPHLLRWVAQYSHTMDFDIEPALQAFRIPYVCFTSPHTPRSACGKRTVGTLPEKVDQESLTCGSRYTFWSHITLPGGDVVAVEAELIVVFVDDEGVIYMVPKTRVRTSDAD